MIRPGVTCVVLGDMGTPEINGRIVTAVIYVPEGYRARLHDGSYARPVRDNWMIYSPDVLPWRRINQVGEGYYLYWGHSRLIRPQCLIPLLDQSPFSAKSLGLDAPQSLENPNYEAFS